MIAIHVMPFTCVEASSRLAWRVRLDVALALRDVAREVLADVPLVALGSARRHMTSPRKIEGPAAASRGGGHARSLLRTGCALVRATHESDPWCPWGAGTGHPVTP